LGHRLQPWLTNVREATVALRRAANQKVKTADARRKAEVLVQSRGETSSKPTTSDSQPDYDSCPKGLPPSSLQHLPIASPYSISL